VTGDPVPVYKVKKGEPKPEGSPVGDVLRKMREAKKSEGEDN
jgi:hypothetical protein